MSTLENIKKMREQAKQAETRYYTPKGGKELRLKDLKEGKTTIRIAPSHSEKFPSPFIPIRTTYLEVELNVDQLSSYNISDLIKNKKLEKQFGIESIADLSEWDDEKLKKKAVEIFGNNFTHKVTKRLFCSNLHGKEGTEDLVDAYIKFVAADMNNSIGDRDEATKKLCHIFGWKDKSGWHHGIIPSISYKSYAWDWEDKNVLRRFEIYSKYMNRIEELYVKFDGDGEPLTIDPFSDIKEGVGLQFDRYVNDKNKMDFRIEDISFSSSDAKKFGTYSNFIKQFELSEEQLNQLKEVKSLQKLYGRGVFKESDFQFQLNGLILFDTKHKYNAFENDEFLEIVKVLAEQYEVDDEQEEDVDSTVEEIKFGSDIDKIFEKKPLQVQQKEDEETELKAAMDLIAKNKAKKAAQKKKDDPLKNQKIEENSFKDESTEDDAKNNESDGKLNSKLAALREKMNKK